MPMRWGQTLAILTLMVALGHSALADDPAPRRFEYRETHMGSEFKVLLYSAAEEEARSASRAAFDRVAALDRSFSDYDPESELMRLCDRAGGPPVEVSSDLFDILGRSLAMHKRSAGAFDITIGPVGRLWRRARRDHKMPDPAHLAAALEKVSSNAVVLDAEKRTAELRKAGMKLDLGGIAKGHACQEALKVLETHGIRHALVAGAGDIAIADPPPDAPGWTIGVAPVEDPGGARPSMFLRLKRRVVSTSGDAERFVEINGKRYSHIVDPKTGLGVVDRAAVTVVADDGALADSLATAVFVLGPEKGLALVETFPNAAAIFVRKSDAGEQRFESKLWKDLPTTTGAGDRDEDISGR